MALFDPLEVHAFDLSQSFSDGAVLERLALATPPPPPLSTLAAEESEVETAAPPLLGSYTPHYLFHPLAPFRMARLMPPKVKAQTKFVVSHELKYPLFFYNFDSELQNVRTLIVSKSNKYNDNNNHHTSIGVPARPRTARSLVVLVQEGNGR